MKNSMINLRTLVVATIALFSVSFASATSLEDGANNLPVNLKYLGANNNSPIFQLSFTNTDIEQFEITVTDKYNTIYTETVKGKGLVRKYQFVSNELNGSSADDELVVEIKNTTTKSVVTYKIHPGAPANKETELVASL
ncbi:MAG: hypothetical protein H7334_01125 [Ferruginibacter sp.]|nr:hypothetical protein [Ferruginibacter sp.]